MGMSAISGQTYNIQTGKFEKMNKIKIYEIEEEWTVSIAYAV